VPEVDRIGCHSSEVLSSVISSSESTRLCGDAVNTEIEYGQSVSCDNVRMSSQELQDPSGGEDDDSVWLGWRSD
jgi:hypothetical protein